MNNIASQNVQTATDSIQKRLTDYAGALTYDHLTADAIHAAKVRIIDTLGALMGGFFGRPCQIARKMAAKVPSPDGATVLGTRLKTTPDMAAFVNSTTSRYVELNDVYHWPGSASGHPSDVVMPVFAAAEHARVSGPDLIAGVVLAYEVYLRISDAADNASFDFSNYTCLATSVAAGKLLGLTPTQLAHCISMAVVPNNILGQVRTGYLSMWKAVASGHAGKAGVFAALLAQEDMEGPHMPFEGKNGWCNYITCKSFALDTMGGNGTPFKIKDTLIKPRSSCASTISSILAAEKVAPRLKGNINAVKSVKVEIYQKAMKMGTGEHHWNPQTREGADHSIPYVVAAAMMDGTVTPRQFNDAHLWSPELRALLPKIQVCANEEFTRDYEKQRPVIHRTRVTVITDSGEQIVGESGGDLGDLSEPKTDAQISEKFRGLTEDLLGTKQVSHLLETLWNLENLKQAATIPALLVLD